jgi:decaprenyl-phosphate phosphoribosyltransferase
MESLMTDRAAPLTDVHDTRMSPALRARASALLALSRPRQWTKNALVLAAPVAAGRIGEAATLSRSVLAFAAFTLMASGVYWVNDALDASADRLHPTKRRRPVAAA